MHLDFAYSFFSLALLISLFVSFIYTVIMQKVKLLSIKRPVLLYVPFLVFLLLGSYYVSAHDILPLIYNKFFGLDGIIIDGVDDLMLCFSLPLLIFWPFAILINIIFEVTSKTRVRANLFLIGFFILNFLIIIAYQLLMYPGL